MNEEKTKLWLRQKEHIFGLSNFFARDIVLLLSNDIELSRGLRLIVNLHKI
jgi:hypothetical protein